MQLPIFINPCADKQLQPFYTPNYTVQAKIWNSYAAYFIIKEKY